MEDTNTEAVSRTTQITFHIQTLFLEIADKDFKQNIQKMHVYIRDPYRPNVIRFRDKVLLLYSELVYLARRVVMRIIMGKSKRDEWFKQHTYSWITPVKNRIMLAKNQQGLEFWIKAGTIHSLLISNSFEPSVLNIFRPHENDVVIDVGANIGKYALYAGMLVGKKGKVIALEPFEETFRLLHRNIKQNDLEDSVIPLRVAISDQNGKTKLFFADDVGEVISLIYRVSDKYVEVDTITIDSLVENMKIRKVDWMKIDVEGAEYNVLLGARETLSKNKLNLVIEVLKVNEEKVFNLLKTLGYSISILESYDYDGYSKKGYYNILARSSHEKSNACQ